MMNKAMGNKQISKLLGIAYRITVLFHLDGVYRLISWTPPLPYLSMAATTATRYARCMELTYAFLRIAELAHLFPTLYRIPESDGATSIERAE